MFPRSWAHWKHSLSSSNKKCFWTFSGETFCVFLARHETGKHYCGNRFVRFPQQFILAGAFRVINVRIFMWHIFYLNQKSLSSSIDTTQGQSNCWKILPHENSYNCRSESAHRVVEFLYQAFLMRLSSNFRIEPSVYNKTTEKNLLWFARLVSCPCSARAIYNPGRPGGGLPCSHVEGARGDNHRLTLRTLVSLRVSGIF